MSHPGDLLSSSAASTNTVQSQTVYNDHLLTPEQHAKLKDFNDSTLLQMTRLRDAMTALASCTDRDAVNTIEQLTHRLILSNISKHFADKHAQHLLPMFKTYCEITEIVPSTSLQSIQSITPISSSNDRSDNSLISAISKRPSTAVKTEPATQTTTSTPTADTTTNVSTTIPTISTTSATPPNLSINSTAESTTNDNPLLMLAKTSPNSRDCENKETNQSSENSATEVDAVHRAASATVLHTTNDDVPVLPPIIAPTASTVDTHSPYKEKTRHVKASDNDSFVSHIGELHLLIYADSTTPATPVSMTIIHRVPNQSSSNYQSTAESGYLILREVDEVLVHKRRIDDHSAKAGFRQWLASRKISCVNATKSELQYVKLAQIIGWRSPNASLLNARQVVDVIESTGRCIDAAALERAMVEYDMSHQADVAVPARELSKTLLPTRGSTQVFAPPRKARNSLKSSENTNNKKMKSDKTVANPIVTAESTTPTNTTMLPSTEPNTNNNTTMSVDVPSTPAVFQVYSLTPPASSSTVASLLSNGTQSPHFVTPAFSTDTSTYTIKPYNTYTIITPSQNAEQHNAAQTNTNNSAVPLPQLPAISTKSQHTLIGLNNNQNLASIAINTTSTTNKANK